MSDKDFICIICKKNYYRRRDLLRSHLLEHADPTSDLADREDNTCPLPDCAAAFYSRRMFESHLKQHLLYHTSSFPSFPPSVPTALLVSPASSSPAFPPSVQQGAAMFINFRTFRKILLGAILLVSVTSLVLSIYLKPSFVHPNSVVSILDTLIFSIILATIRKPFFQSPQPVATEALGLFTLLPFALILML
ncbi:hypothetical protein C8R45DRAFT_984239 [Mycena sanguinolenta]|nr:hypothetical protein C8R45DRAFT_984239 [Mycena sanguinolenta]